MAAPAGRLTDARYINWVKDTLALIYLKEGLEVFVDTQSAVFHSHLITTLGSRSCGTCSRRDLVKRKGNWTINCHVCQPWLTQIISKHKYRPLPALATGNSDPQLWTTDAWEVIKLYQAKGCQNHHSARDTDVAGILAVIGNCDHFHSFVSNLNLVDKIRDIRNRCMHSRDLHVETVELGRDLQTMLQFLRGLSLSGAEQDSANIAIEKIRELRTGLLDLSFKELELRALQLKQNALATDLNSVKQELAATSEKASTTEDAVNTIQADLEASNAKRAKLETDLTEKIRSVEERLKKLQALQDSFNRFLQANNLVQDMARLSKASEHHEHRIENLETHSQNLDVTTKKQEGEIATLYQRQQATNTELQERLRDSQAHESQLQTHTSMLASHGGRLERVEGRLQNQADSGAGEITYEDIPALQGRLKHYYRTMCLTVPNPVVSEEVGLDRLYVDPDIKVLRETTDPHTGLENVQDQPTKAQVSQCRQLFYSKDNKCRQIYITADAGLGKSMFCKHLVDLWCKADSEIVTNTEDRNSKSSGANFSGHSDSGEGGCRNIASQDCAFCPREIIRIDSECSESDGILSKVSDSEVSDSEDSNFWSSDNSDSEDAFWPGMNEAEKKRMEEDRRIMSEFNLLFYITLRESPDQYHVADMIDSQILQENEEMQHLKASVLLKKVPCLVIIDGLDEWVCPADAKIARFVKPGIPGRDWLNTSNVFLTTTRPWKFDVLQLTSKEVDKHVELVGFNSYASVTLCSKVTELLKRKEQVQRIEGNLQAELRRKGLSHLSNIPVILTQLVCLWFDKQHLSESQVQLYCSMLEMLLKRADKNLPKQTCASKLETAREEIQLPECFLSREQCQTYQMLLVKLCKVAFEALFNQKREQALVFESFQMGILGEDHINVDLCLKSGILSQSKVLGKWSRSEKKLSFLHKKLQEFLAAVFITCANEETIISRVKQFCTSVESMLEMSQVWMFLSGINCHVAKQLLTNLMTSVVLKDSRLQQYRQTLENPALAQSIQTCIIECVKEATCNGHNDLCLPLEDFVINNDTISTCLERLLTFNTAAIKSVYIETTYDMTPDTVERVMCQLQDTQCLQKLSLVDYPSVITNMQPLHRVDPSSAITTMQPLCKTLDNNKDTLTCLMLVDIKLTTELYDDVCRALTHVTALQLCNVRLTHKQIEQLLLSVSQAQHIRQLKLGLRCTDHGWQCRAGIDVSGLTQLRTLELWYMYIARLPVMTDCLESVVLRHVTISESQLRQFIHALSSTSHTLKVTLWGVTVTVDSDTPADLTYLKHNPKLVVTQCQYYDSDNRWSIEFHTKQQTTTASDNQN